MNAGQTEFISGAMSMAYLVTALFFVRLWRDTRDRLFLFFSTAFGLLAAQRTTLSLLVGANAALEVSSYGLRLLAFLLILAAIVDKNLRR